MRHSIWTKFGTEQQICNIMAATLPNMKILKIQDGGWPQYWKMLETL